jgi:hypothetical protein
MHKVDRARDEGLEEVLGECYKRAYNGTREEFLKEAGACKNLRDYAARLAGEMGLTERDGEDLVLGALANLASKMPDDPEDVEVVEGYRVKFMAKYESPAHFRKTLFKCIRSHIIDMYRAKISYEKNREAFADVKRTRKDPSADSSGLCDGGAAPRNAQELRDRLLEHLVFMRDPLLNCLSALRERLPGAEDWQKDGSGRTNRIGYVLKRVKTWIDATKDLLRIIPDTPKEGLDE